MKMIRLKNYVILSILSLYTWNISTSSVDDNDHSTTPKQDDINDAFDSLNDGVTGITSEISHLVIVTSNVTELTDDDRSQKSNRNARAATIEEVTEEDGVAETTVKENDKHLIVTGAGNATVAEATSETPHLVTEPPTVFEFTGNSSEKTNVGDDADAMEASKEDEADVTGQDDGMETGTRERLSQEMSTTRDKSLFGGGNSKDEMTQEVKEEAATTRQQLSTVQSEQVLTSATVLELTTTVTAQELTTTVMAQELTTVVTAQELTTGVTAQELTTATSQEFTTSTEQVLTTEQQWTTETTMAVVITGGKDLDPDERSAITTILHSLQTDLTHQPTTASEVTTGPPPTINLYALSDSELSVTWNQIGGYVNCCLLFHESEMLCNVTNETSFTWRNLTPGQTYMTSITYFEDVENIAHLNATMNTFPARPSQFHPFNVSTSSVVIGWTQTGIADNFSFTLNSSLVDVKWRRGGKEESELTVYAVIDNLSVPGQLYMVRVTAASKALSSNESEEFHFRTKPSKPGSLVVNEQDGSNKFQISWNQSGIADDFLVSVNVSDTGTTQVKMECLSTRSIEHFSTVNCTIRRDDKDELRHGFLYEVTAVAKSKEVESDKTFGYVITKPLMPNLIRVDNFSNRILLIYSYPDVYDATCTHYEITVDPMITIDKNGLFPCHNSEIPLNQLRDNTEYEIRIKAVSDYGKSMLEKKYSSTNTSNHWTTPHAVNDLTISDVETESLKVNWKYLSNSRNGSIFKYQLLIFSNKTGHKESRIIDCNQADCNSEQINYVFENLTPNSNYTIIVNAVNRGGDGDNKMISGKTKDAEPKSLLVAIGVVACCLLIVVGIAVTLCLVSRKKRRFTVPSSKRPSDVIGFPNPSFSTAMESVEACESLKPKCVPIAKFSEHLELLHVDSDYRFSAEYSLLSELSPKLAQTAAELPENRMKNRYSNILPFDHARVKLIPLDEDELGSDYINASFMPGFVSKREFIAAQGPMNSTVDDFWRMIWEQNTNTIVMVTNLEERGREKCAHYWPDVDDEPVFYGDLQVALKSESQLNYYIIRILQVQLGDKKRIIKQLHFIAWPDFGCPENTAVLLEFVLGVRSHMSSQPSQGSSPILVHCSAGVGRTGTFIIIDRLLQHIQIYDTIDIFGIVLEMRNNRCNMIQTEAQYIFAHECIKAAIERQNQFRNGVDRDTFSHPEEEEEEEEQMYQNISNKAVNGGGSPIKMTTC